jgi:hypothetical protein
MMVSVNNADSWFIRGFNGLADLLENRSKEKDGEIIVPALCGRLLSQLERCISNVPTPVQLTDQVIDLAVLTMCQYLVQRLTLGSFDKELFSGAINQHIARLHSLKERLEKV